jgi:hypothetical protein
MNKNFTVAPIRADGSYYVQDFDLPLTPLTSPRPTSALISTSASYGDSQ